MAEIRWSCLNLLLLSVTCLLVAASADTNAEDVAALTSLKTTLWQRAPRSWGKPDPCDAPWVGVSCNNSRVTSLKLSSMGLQGGIDDIGSLTQLQVLDLSSNPGLSGPIPASIGNLMNLTTLILAACNFTGSIPNELGNLERLLFLALNSNNLAGHIPATFGKLSNVYWLDIADNFLSGPLPISSGNTPGLDMLLKAKHFHFNRNQLSGPVPPQLFSSKMVLIHILFDGNKFSGPIPSTIGLVKTLQALRLDRNSFSGPVPPTLSNLIKINELNLAHNQLTGPLPNLTQMSNLNYVDLSNNSFDATAAPSWFKTTASLTTLVMEFGRMEGEIPQPLFSLPSLQKVRLRYNAFNGTVDMGSSISPLLQYVDLEYNRISLMTLGVNYPPFLMLAGNPICSTIASTRYCHLRAQQDAQVTYSTSLNCHNAECPLPQKRNPKSCECAYPYEGVLCFRAITFSDLSNVTAFQSLEQHLWTQLDLAPGSVVLQHPYFDPGDYVFVNVSLFPSNGKYFERSQVLQMGFDLTNHTFKQPPEFGPYVFQASPYPFPGNGGKSLSSGAIIGIVVGCSVLVLVLLAVGVYAIRQKKRGGKAISQSRPFGSWGGTSCKDSVDAPQLKGARWFSYDEVKKCTNNFSASNEIGFGGYGKVYRGILPNGQMVAIKRATQGSMQGGAEFKTEIELLSRVHHKNLVGLVGFCFDRGEQMLVYEFIPNGTLRDSLSGRSGIHLDWKRRLRISLGSARGLAYLHELANPPIIHRDVKSTNILLDESLVAKVADFGLSKLVADSAKGHVSTQVKGTLGYLDPEYYMSQQLTEKSDVYSFGVVMLELLTARPPIERGRYIVREVRMAIDKTKELYGLGQLLDPALRSGVALVGFEKFVDLAMRCAEESASVRPAMGEVVKAIETILQKEGVSTNPASASSSATDFGTSKGAPHHPYSDPLPGKEQHSDAFTDSGGYTLSTKVEPK